MRTRRRKTKLVAPPDPAPNVSEINVEISSPRKARKGISLSASLKAAEEAAEKSIINSPLEKDESENEFIDGLQKQAVTSSQVPVTQEMPLTQMHQPTQRNLPPLPVPDFLEESFDETIPKNNEILSSDDEEQEKSPAGETLVPDTLDSSDLTVLDTSVSPIQNTNKSDNNQISSKLDEKSPEKAGDEDSKNSEEYFDVPNTMNETYVIEAKSSENSKETSNQNDKDSAVNMPEEETKVKETPQWAKNFVNDEKIEIEETSCEEFYTELFPSKPVSKISEEFLDQKQNELNLSYCKTILQLIGNQNIDDGPRYSVQNYIEEEFGKRFVYDMFLSDLKEKLNRKHLPKEKRTFGDWYYDDMASFATDIRKIYGLDRFQHLTIKFLKEYVAASEGVRIPENTLYYTDGLALMSKFGEKQDFPIFQNYMKKLRKLIKKGGNKPEEKQMPAKKLNKSPENHQKYDSPEMTSRKRKSLEELVMRSNSQESPEKSLLPPKRLRLADFYIVDGELIPKSDETFLNREDAFDGEKLFQSLTKQRKSRHSGNFGKNQSNAMADDEMPILDEIEAGSSKVTGKTANVEKANDKENVPIIVPPGKAPRRSCSSAASNISFNSSFRHYWTSTEDDLLRAGIAEFGVGKWRNICDAYFRSDDGETRTQIQIKDRYRVLKKKKAL